MKSKYLLFLALTMSFLSQSQNDKLPYYEVPDYPETFTAGTMASRMVDALGFRFYWASFDLKDKDLNYKANDAGRSVKETINHIYDLSKIIVNATQNKANDRVKEDLSYTDMRSKTLINLKTASDILKNNDDISQFDIIFGTNKIPFWNLVNGPIADAIWHCGQIATSRRSTGNPINPNVNHFMGTVKN